MHHIVTPELALQLARDRQRELTRDAHIARHASEVRRLRRDERRARRVERHRIRRR